MRPPNRYNLLQAAEDITTTATSAQSTAAPAGTNAARICGTQAVRVLWAANPTALSTSLYVPANVETYIPIIAGQKLAAIRESADGKLSVGFLDI